MCQGRGEGRGKDRLVTYLILILTTAAAAAATDNSSSMVNAKRGGGEGVSVFFFSSVLLFLVVGSGKLNCPRGLESGGYCFSYHFPPPLSLVIFDNTAAGCCCWRSRLSYRIDGFLFIWRQDGTGLFANWGSGWAGGWSLHYFGARRFALGFETKEGRGDWRQRRRRRRNFTTTTAIINAHTFHVHPPRSPPIVSPVVSGDREENAFAARGKMETMTLCVLGRRRREGRRRRGGGE